MRKSIEIYLVVIFLLVFQCLIYAQNQQPFGLKSVSADQLTIIRQIEARSIPLIKDVVWYSDENKYAFVIRHRRDATLWVGTRDKTEKKKVITGERIGKIEWSPEGQKIAFTLKDKTEKLSEIIIYDLASDSVVARISGDYSYAYPSWAPDGKKIAFAQRRTGKAISIYIANSNGSGIAYLTEGVHPAWSPSGGIIAFVRSERDLSRNKWLQYVWLVNVDGSGEQKLTGTRNAAKPIWSPTGVRLAYETPLGIYDAETEQYIEIDKREGSNISWSLDGRTLAFEVTDVDLEGRIMNIDVWLVNSDGSGLINLTDTENIWESNPKWISSNEMLVVIYHPGGNSEMKILELGSK